MAETVIDQAHLKRLAEEIGNLYSEYEIDVQIFTVNMYVTKEFYQSIKNNFHGIRLIDRIVGAREKTWSIDIMYLSRPWPNQVNTPITNPEEIKLRALADRLPILFEQFGLEYDTYALSMAVSQDYYDAHKQHFSDRAVGIIVDNATIVMKVPYF